MPSPDLDIPSVYTIKIQDLDFFDVRATATVVGDTNRPVATLMTGDARKPIATLMTGDASKPIATTVDLLNIPHLTLEDVKDLLTPKLRIRMPNYEQVCFKIFGIDIFSLCMSGEFQAITEGYEPNDYEKCEIDCPDLDKRPFPKTRTHKSDVK